MTARRQRRGRVLCNGRLAGLIEETTGGGYRFSYDRDYLSDPRAASISLTLPLRSAPYEADRLFPFFHGLLAEGGAKAAQCRKLKLDEDDHFGRLLRTAGGDVIGAVHVEEVIE